MAFLYVLSHRHHKLGEAITDSIKNSILGHFKQEIEVFARPILVRV